MKLKINGYKGFAGFVGILSMWFAVKQGWVSTNSEFYQYVMWGLYTFTGYGLNDKANKLIGKFFGK